MSHPIDQIDPTEASRRISGGGVLLLDVRTPDEFAAGHAPAAVLLPLGELSARISELDPATPIVAICRSGARSHSAAEELVGAGYDVVNLAGGSLAWQAAGFELVAEDGSPGTVS
jgi:rhodanese-related sulfurtransferase